MSSMSSLPFGSIWVHPRFLVCIRVANRCSFLRCVFMFWLSLSSRYVYGVSMKCAFLFKVYCDYVTSFLNIFDDRTFSV